jgi:hypothetical protein
MHLAAWEPWNEVDHNEGFDPAANEAWHREMAGYLKSLDPWKHQITASWRDSRMFALPGLDIVQAHSYWEAEYAAAQYAIEETDHLMRPHGKPFFFGEQGVEDPGGAVSFDPEGNHFHDALWASALSGAAGAGMYWWWDTARGTIVRLDAGQVDHSRHFEYGLELKSPEYWRDIAARVTRKVAQ